MLVIWNLFQNSVEKINLRLIEYILNNYFEGWTIGTIS